MRGAQAVVTAVGLAVGLTLGALWGLTFGSYYGPGPAHQQPRVETAATVASEYPPIVSATLRMSLREKLVNTQLEHAGVTARLPLRSLLMDVRGSTGHRYGLRDSRGVGMDCLRVIYAPLGATRRYLGVYHHRDAVTQSFHVNLAQSFNLLTWEFLRRLVMNADMPAITLDASSQQVLLIFEQWVNANSAWPCRLGFKIYRSPSHLLAGDAIATFVAPNLLSTLEGTPNVYRWNPRAGVVEVGFHFFNRSVLRDEVGRGVLDNFPGQPEWQAWPCGDYNRELTQTMGVTGNIGGRQPLRFQGQDFIVQEGNVQPLPGVPTVWHQWRVWLYTNKTGHFAPLKVQTHNGSLALANPWAAELPGPAGDLIWLVTFYIFGAGAARGEAGTLLFYHTLPT